MLTRARTQALPRVQRGASLIEVLVTLVILMIGLLGLAGVTTRANVAAVESFQRVQALELVQDMAARLRGNARNAACYDGKRTDKPPTDSGGAPLSLCQEDLKDWSDRVNANADNQETDAAARDQLIGALGCIDQASTNQNATTYRIALAWQGLQPTDAPTQDGAAFPCGADRYRNSDGKVDERLHRVVSIEVVILTPWATP